MPIYISLVRTTEKGLANISEMAQMIESTRTVLRSNGIKDVKAYSTIGPYDFVLLFKAPDEGSVMKSSAQIHAEGNFEADTIPAVKLEDFLKKLQ